MRRIFFFILLLFAITVCRAQVKITKTESFNVEVNENNKYTFSLNSLNGFHIRDLGDISTLNHLGQPRDTRTGIKGVLLKEIISRVPLNAVKPKELFGYYLILTATDGYKVVLSRNEVFSGDNFYVITGENGNSWKASSDRIEILELLGSGKGHIYIKGLENIKIKNVQEK